MWAADRWIAISRWTAHGWAADMWAADRWIATSRWAAHGWAGDNVDSN